MKEKLQRLGSDGAEKLGKALAEACLAFGSQVPTSKYCIEAFKTSGVSAVKESVALKESYGTAFADLYSRGAFKEDLTTQTGAGAYATVLAKTLLSASWNKLEMIKDALVIFDDMSGQAGGGALQVPLFAPTTAVEVAEGEAVARYDLVDSATILPKQFTVATSISWKFSKIATPAVLNYVLTNATNAVYRKLASEIISNIVAAAEDAGSVVYGFNSNPYGTIIDAAAKVNSAVYADSSIPYGFECSHVFLSFMGEATLKKSSDYKQQIQYAIITDTSKLGIDKPIEYVNRMKLVVTPFFTSDVAGFVLDKNYAFAFAKWSDVESFEAFIPSRPADKEIYLTTLVGMMSLYPLAIAVMYTADES